MELERRVTDIAANLTDQLKLKTKRTLLVFIIHKRWIRAQTVKLQIGLLHCLIQEVNEMFDMFEELVDIRSLTSRQSEQNIF